MPPPSCARVATPVARVYESIGADFFLAISPGWLNLGLWQGPGTEDEAETACRRLVQTVADPLPTGGVILDAGNGLGTQDPVIAGQVRPARLPAVNITEWQLAAGRDRLRPPPRWPGTLAGLTQLRVFGMRASAAMTAAQIAATARAAGLVDVQVRLCGAEVIAPAVQLTAARLACPTSAPAGQHVAAQLLLRQVDLLYRRHIIDYLLLRAVRR